MTEEIKEALGDGRRLDVLLSDDGLSRSRAAALIEKGYPLLFQSPTNQIFPILDREAYDRLSPQVSFGFWEQLDERHTAARFATSWATTQEDVQALIDIL